VITRSAYVLVPEILGYKRGIFVPNNDKIPNDNGELETVRRIYYWLAEIRGIQWDRIAVADVLVVSIVKTDKWTKGVMVMSSVQNPPKSTEDIHLPEHLTGKNPKRSVTIENWQDPVAKHMEAINIFPYKSGRPLYSLTMRYGTEVMNGQFTIDLEPAYSEWVIKLWQALLETIIHLADLYDDDEVKEYVRYPKLKGILEHLTRQQKE
jgi:hypothetical protein